MTKIRRRAALALGLGVPFIARGARAQGEWPTRPIRLVIPFTAGGGGDSSARPLAAKMAEILGQNVVVENRTGGNAVVAASAVLQARDGYTFLVDAANQITNPLLLRDLPFDYRTSFLPVTQTARFPQVLAVRRDFPAQNVAEFIAYAKANPGRVSCGTPPAAGAGHLALALLEQRAGIRLLHAPYRGGADAARDIMGGQIDSMILTSSTARAPIETGRARPLALTGAERLPTLPDVPTLAESGFPGFDMDDWNGLFAPAGTPAPVIVRLQAAVAEACRDPGVLARMAPLGTVLGGQPTEVFAAWVERQREVAAQVIRDAGITLG
ncbi:Bug family tripartite tricarboxylate transporter substrate binding protein [Falsiroseomonas stagni]|uniref:Tripartite-type tricarboxylate transporter, receptor component TctC n=1 Tax=Falsiroseomonas stagni DSM 19981 TaxID=1123062 RepID=A0A1I4AXS3_9PROT|nr:tripartite tricarboxylate transporter substrate binding protein [Falsiroseomonas stagni]SFK60717.1 Tripartite-type tricarboxylate transporter, receptor component TctC [Falsiroseomonas stagni DSM 19981]